MAVAADALDAFVRVTGRPPYDYQRSLAERVTPPAVIDVPTGSGKTLAVLIPWVCDPQAPRRLVYALPMRALVEQTAAVVRETLDRLGRRDVAVHVLMGGVEPADWRDEVDRRAVIVGTIDMLLSRALNRGYAEGRFVWPVSFGLLNNDCRWIFDEVQIMGPARTTSAQLDGLRSVLGVARRCETIWMSATIDPTALRTVDRPELGDVVRLSAADRAGPLAARLEAVKRVERVDLTKTPTARQAVAIAAEVADRHRPGTRSVVVVNRVDIAQSVHAALVKHLRRHPEPPNLVLLHSRFRPPDRAEHMAEALAQPGSSGTIVVSTQVIEAGVDMTSALLATETAPFSSVVQRLGRLNRGGEEVEIEARALWLDRGPLDARAAAPYHPDDMDSARTALACLEGESASPAVLETFKVIERREVTAVLRRRDLLDLFDTAPDLSGADVDVAPFVREDDERTVGVFYRPLGTLSAEEIGAQPAPARDELVSVPIGALKEVGGYTFDIVDTRWRRAEGERRARPGGTLMLDVAAGRYDAARGWTGKTADVPEPLRAAEFPPQGVGSDPGSVAHEWVTLHQHLEDAHSVAQELCAALDLPSELTDPVIHAAAVHDIGKAHAAFQTMLLGTAAEEERERLKDEVWAKSAHRGGRHERPHFRHELASALALNGGVDPLTRYLVAAHHGRVRLSIRPAPAEECPRGAPPDARFALGVVEGDVLPAVRTPVGRVPEANLDLREMELGGGPRSWTALACDLRDQHGPFVLGYLEAVVRLADWRASG